jgi:hypothetical protein
MHFVQNIPLHSLQVSILGLCGHFHPRLGLDFTDDMGFVLGIEWRGVVL